LRSRSWSRLAAILLASVWSPKVSSPASASPLSTSRGCAAAVVVAVAFARGATNTSSLAGGQGTGAVLLLLPGLVVFIAAVLAARAVGFVSRLLERAGRRARSRSGLPRSPLRAIPAVRRSPSRS
jgi:hypothetical protein